jgi:DNA-binding beta-propeller fold protein YncE
VTTQHEDPPADGHTDRPVYRRRQPCNGRAFSCRNQQRCRTEQHNAQTASKHPRECTQSSLIDSFTVGGDGRLTAAPSSPFAAQGAGPFGSEFRPTNSTQLFVSNAHDGAGNGTVSAFTDQADGTLTSIGSSPFANHQTAPCWVEISHDGQYLFAINTAVSTISSYSIATDGSLTLLTNTAMKSPSGRVPDDARLSPDGSTLWVVDTGADAVSGFSVNGGTLTELASSPTPAPTGATPAGIVVT